MSELLVNTIKKADGTGSLSVPAESGTVVTTASPSLGRRNLIINGAMQVAQRGTSSVNGNGSFPVDRFAISNTQASKYTGQQSSTAPANFKNSVVLTSSSAYTVVAGDAFNFYQRMEGYDVAHLGFGTSDAQEFTLSFYVRSSLTGTFAGFLSNGDYNRSYVFEYTINTANTWERKTITLTADTTGTWGTTNGRGLSVHWSVGTGSTYHTTAGSWQAGNYQSTSSATNLVGTNGATLYITGVQLEVGSVASSYEHRSFGEELALCQRYCFILANDDDTSEAMPIGARGFNTDQAECDVIFPTEMRTLPTLLQLGSGTNWRARYSNFSVDWSTFTWWTQSSRRGGLLYNGSLSGITIGNCYRLARISGSAYLIFDAEL